MAPWELLLSPPLEFEGNLLNEIDTFAKKNSKATPADKRRAALNPQSYATARQLMRAAPNLHAANGAHDMNDPHKHTLPHTPISPSPLSVSSVLLPARVSCVPSSLQPAQTAADHWPAGVG